MYNFLIFTACFFSEDNFFSGLCHYFKINELCDTQNRVYFVQYRNYSEHVFTYLQTFFCQPSSYESEYKLDDLQITLHAISKKDLKLLKVQ